VRSLEQEILDTLQGKALSDWLTSQKKPESNVVEYKITSDRQLWAQDRLERENKNRTARTGSSNPAGIPFE
jgi:hypothetical protein